MRHTRHFQDQVVIVTGASSGIGRSVALAFGAAGARVVLVARSVDALEALAQEMRQQGHDSFAVPSDVTDRRQVAAMVAAVIARWGRIDILVNNAGIGAHGPFWWTRYEDFERIVRVNLFGVAYCTSAVLPHMIRKRSGKIVNVSSMIGKRAYPGNAAYCASKFALEGFAESLRTEVRHHGIHVIQVCPGLTETAFFDRLLQTGGHRKPARPGMSSDKVAALLLEATRRNQREIVIGARGKILVLFDKLLPGLLDRLLQRRFRDQYAAAGLTPIDCSRAAAATTTSPWDTSRSSGSGARQRLDTKESAREQKMESVVSNDLLISAVVTTYKRSNILRRVLDYLARQDLSPRQFEVIVADDGSPDDTRAVVAQFAAGAPFPVRHVYHKNTGIGYTENRGIEAASAPIVLLLADDIFLTRQGLRKHLEFHQAHPEPTVAVLGKTLQSPDLNQSAFLRKWDPFRFDELEDLEELPPYRFGAMNLSFKRDFVMQHGMFLEHRGRGGAACMEDLELGYRLQPHGLRLYYSKEALAFHYHLTTLDVAMIRWYERGLNYGEFRRFAPNPELTVYFHVLTFRTLREYIRVLLGPNSFRGAERSLAWHFVRHFSRMITLNRITARWFWRPLFDLAEKHKWLESLVTAKMYRAFLYYQFLRGVRAGRRIYGD